MKFKNNKYKLVALLEWAYLLAVIVISLIYVNNWMCVYIDSDMASMLVQDKLLADENAIISPNWYYSTEISVISHNLIFPFLFKFISDWHIVRNIGYILLYCLFAIAFIYMLRKMHIGHAPLFTSLLFMPVSNDYFSFVTASCEYISILILTFFSIGLIIDISFSESKCSYIKFTVLIIIAFLSGMQGFRQAFMLYFPVLISSIIFLLLYKRKNINYNNMKMFVKSCKVAVVSCMSFLACFLGSIINVAILSKYYSFSTLGNGSKLAVTNFSFNKLESFINFLFSQFGFNGSAGSLSLRSVASNFYFVIIFVILFFAVLFILYKNSSKFSDCQIFIVWIFLIGLFLILLIMCFSNFVVTNRNLISISVLYIPIIAILIESNTNKVKNFILCVVVFCSIMVFGSFYRTISSANYLDTRTDAEMKELPAVAKIISDNGLSSGYTSTYYGSVIVELTNGNTEVWNYGLTNGGLRTDKLSKWFQEKSHFINKPEGRIFVLLNTTQDNDTYFIDRGKLNILYKSGTFTLYSFDNVSQLENNLIQNVNTKDLNSYIKE